VRLLTACSNQARPPSRRLLRRSDVVTYRVRIDLKGTKPPVWRRLELASDLDGVLADVGDKLFYVYDWGDHWQHIIKLEAVLSCDDHALRAVCTRGRRPGPAEDCGGVYAYELIAAATDLDDPDHAERPRHSTGSTARTSTRRY
jgi:hypothetical protein